MQSCGAATGRIQWFFNCFFKEIKQSSVNIHHPSLLGISFESTRSPRCPLRKVHSLGVKATLNLNPFSALALDYFLGVHGSSHVVRLNCGGPGSGICPDPQWSTNVIAPLKIYFFLCPRQERFIKICAASGTVVGPLETKLSPTALLSWSGR